MTKADSQAREYAKEALGGYHPMVRDFIMGTGCFSEDEQVKMNLRVAGKIAQKASKAIMDRFLQARLSELKGGAQNESLRRWCQAVQARAMDASTKTAAYRKEVLDLQALVSTYEDRIAELTKANKQLDEGYNAAVLAVSEATNKRLEAERQALFAKVSERSSEVSKTGEGQSGMRTERVQIPPRVLGETMNRPRDLRHRGSIRGECQPLEASVEVPIANSITGQPREWRRAAAWLRQVADWWDWLADQQEMKHSRPIRRRLIVCVKEEGR